MATYWRYSDGTIVKKEMQRVLFQRESCREAKTAPLNVDEMACLIPEVIRRVVDAQR